MIWYYEVVPRKLKKSAKQTDNIASKEVQHVKEKYHPSLSFIIFDISAPKHGVHLEHKIYIALEKHLASPKHVQLNFVCLFVCLFVFSSLPSFRH